MGTNRMPALHGNSCRAGRFYYRVEQADRVIDEKNDLIDALRNQIARLQAGGDIQKTKEAFDLLSLSLHGDDDYCLTCQFARPADEPCDGCGADFDEDGRYYSYTGCGDKLKPCWNDPSKPVLRYFPWCADYHPEFKPCPLVAFAIKLKEVAPAPKLDCPIGDPGSPGSASRGVNVSDGKAGGDHEGGEQ